MRKKRFLFLLLSALCSVGSTYAQKNIGSYDKDDAGNEIYSLKTAMEELSNLSTYKAAYDNANATLKTIQDKEPKEINNDNPTKTAYERIIKAMSSKDGSQIYFCEVQLGFNTFVAMVTDRSLLQRVAQDWYDTTDDALFWKRDPANKTGEWISLKDESKSYIPTSEDMASNTDQNLLENSCWSLAVFDKTAQRASFYLSTDCDYAYLYYERSDKTLDFVEAEISENSSNKNLVDLISKPANKSALLNIPSISITDPELVKESDTYKAWKKDRDAAQGALTTAQNNYTNAQAFQKITITDDITVPEGSQSLGVWPSSCTLTGNYNHIINNSGKPLFAENNGTIQNLFSLDIDIADEGTGRMRNCIIKSHWDNKYYIYGGVGTAGQGFALLEDAIYSERGTYGIDFSNGATVGRVTDATRLYAVQYANANKTGLTTFKVNIKEVSTDDDTDYIFYGRSGEMSRDNNVVYIDRNIDSEIPDAVDNLTNVAVKDGNGNYICEDVVLTDGKDSQDFYVPTAFTATKLTYDRTIKTKYVSVCLPFGLTAEQLKDLDAKAYTFASASTTEAQKQKMKFAPKDFVEANTPYILVFQNVSNDTPFNYNDVNMTIVATPKKLSSKDNNPFFGNYKANQTAGMLAEGKNAGSYVYGVQNEKFVKMGNGAYMNAFRSFVVLSEDISQTPTGEARTFTISLLDEDGNEEVTGIELVSMANNTNSDFKAVGGRNAIEITTGKACDVKVYTLNGALAKTARVEAGTTTLPMNAGMYVVNKTKVIVK